MAGNSNFSTMTDTATLETLLRKYYKEYFPLNDLIRWLNYGQPEKLHRREFSFVLINQVFIRYQSFDVAKQMEIQIQKLLPHKIDIGSIYNVPPRKGTKMFPVEKELVFDIDISDYDNVRSCCKQANTCAKCWKYVAIAVKILDSTLREDFGYKHILWVFSGRRGVHCWVCDKSARAMDTNGRRAIVKYLTLLIGSTDTKKIYLPEDHVHPFISRSIEIIRPQFFTLCIFRQNILGTEEGMKNFIRLIPNKTVQNAMPTFFQRYSSSVERWDQFLSYYKSDIKYDRAKWPNGLRFFDELALEFCCLRLDIQVTKDTKHLLKCPFSIHPATGKVSIPFDPSEIDTFYPHFNPPTIDQLCNALTGEFTQHQLDNKKNFENSLKVFSEFLQKLEKHKYD